VREIRTLHAMWRVLETELRQLLNGHEEGNLGYRVRKLGRGGTDDELAKPLILSSSGCKSRLTKVEQTGQ